MPMNDCKTLSSVLSTRIGILGSGHLGVALAQALIAAGLPRGNLLLGNRHSRAAQARLEQAGLEDRYADNQRIVDESQLILLTVRPQDYRALGGLQLKSATVLVSFIAGLPVERIRSLFQPPPQVIRVMVSAPDTIAGACAIGARYGADSVLVDTLLRQLGIELINLPSQAEFDAFTVYGPCLPIVLTYCESLAVSVSQEAIASGATACNLPPWGKVIAWANAVRPRGLDDRARRDYLHSATTPGGVTEALLDAVGEGLALSDCFRAGIARSQRLAS
ncbi:pyrroline-5-carboxylate reductase [Pseudomonas sp. W4I3]|uniref:pyrroline-5-carboxylate reductase family protein n=1 Tax=Pseudomonas sp. W4I3 TaxID=3042294 RepID=UPI0027805573|nr:NAD(P)-binding domain-containing protein [Pseudomonas sp. W4I3]MDQ0740473.1 pyrroline-5-carboxylate reductase [Pseudomonas sp. W4I3]